MFENGWNLLYFNKTSELFSEKSGILITNDIPNPFVGTFTNVSAKQEFEHIHPKTKECYIYQLYEYKFGDYLLRYLKSEIDSGSTAVWRKVEPNQQQELPHIQSLDTSEQFTETKDTYGVYHSVPGMEKFIKHYMKQDFLQIWNEYDAFLKEKYSTYAVPLLPGNSQKSILEPFEIWKLAPLNDFLTLFRVCNGQSVSRWLEILKENDIAYAHLNGYPLLTLEEIVAEVKGARANLNTKQSIESIPPHYIKDNFMLVNKIPIYHDGGGNFTAIDLDPDINGTYGQIVSVDHEYVKRIVLARSLKEYILILYYFVKELGVIDNGEGFDGKQPFEKYIN